MRNRADARSILDYFRSGREIDAAVKRSVRLAVKADAKKSRRVLGVVERPQGKTVTDYFISGKEIDAAVRRAVRQAVGLSSPSRAKAKPTKKKAASRKISASAKRSAPRRKAA